MLPQRFSCHEYAHIHKTDQVSELRRTPFIDVFLFRAIWRRATRQGNRGKVVF